MHPVAHLREVRLPMNPPVIPTERQLAEPPHHSSCHLPSRSRRDPSTRIDRVPWLGPPAIQFACKARVGSPTPPHTPLPCLGAPLCARRTERRVGAMWTYSLVFLAAATASSADTDPQCESWAASGECDRNRAFMKDSCATACSCEQWAAAGECTHNSAFMLVRCTPACERQEKSPPLPPPPPGHDEYECEGWAASGECDRNRGFMKDSCARACSCEQWASTGECERNGAFMLDRCTPACERRLVSPPPPPSSDCAKWASIGECEANAAFMATSCEAACAKVAQLAPCSARACAGLPESVCDAEPPPEAYGWAAGGHADGGNSTRDEDNSTSGGHSSAAALRRPWLVLPHLSNMASPIAVTNDAASPARLMWVDSR